jgi:hypothetical protein
VKVTLSIWTSFDDPILPEYVNSIRTSTVFFILEKTPPLIAKTFVNAVDVIVPPASGVSSTYSTAETIPVLVTLRALNPTR